MTVSTTLNRKSYLGDSTTVAFATEFMFLEDTDLDVYLVASDGSATLLTLNTHYTVAGAGSLSGGTVTMVTPPATGERLVLARNIESTQEIDLETTSDMPPASIERMADKLTMLIQQNSTVGQRVLTIPITDSELISTELPAAASRAGKVLCFDSIGAPKALDIATTETSVIGDGLEIDVNTLKVTADVERTTNKGQADGYAELDSSGVVPDAQLSGKLKVSSNDTTAGYLSDKITGATINNPSGNETLTISTVFTGAIMWASFNTPPTGWLECNGAAISRTTYAALYTSIGTTFGVGDGSTTFNLPDLRGEFVRGWDDGRGVDSGRVFGSSQVDEFKSHTHTLNTGSTGFDGISNITGPGNYMQPPGDFGVGYTGGTETRPRNIALMPVIKY